MRLERSYKDYGGGSGKEVYESENFRVVKWKLQRGIRTTISCRLAGFLEADFDGEYDFNTDELCMEQFTCEEIVGMLEFQKEKSFSEGEKAKAKQIRDCLVI